MTDTTLRDQQNLTLPGLKTQLTQQGYGDELATLQDEQGQEDTFLAILPPGIEVKDIRAFLQIVLAELGDAWDILPASLPVDGVRLSSLNFSPQTASLPFELDFTVDWVSAHWEMIPGVLALASPSITVNIRGKADPDDHLHVSGTTSGIVEIEEIPIYVEIDLPNGTFKAELLKQDDSGTSTGAGSLLHSFQVGGEPQHAENGQGFDLGALTLDDLTVLGSIPARRLLLHLALGQFQLGPGELAAQLTIDYFGGEDSQLSGQVWGQYDIHKDGGADALFSLMLAAAYDGPGKSWKFEGGAASASDGAVMIADLIAAFTDTGGIPGVFDQLGIRYLHLTYETGSGDFAFQCDVEVKDLFGADAKVEMIVDVHLQKVGDATGALHYTKTFRGRLLFALANDTVLEFDLLFDQSPTGKAADTTFIAAYKNPSGGDLNIGDLIQLIESNVDVPLSIELQDAFFVYDKHAAQNGSPARSNSLFGLDIGGGIDLSALPLVGKVIDEDASLTFGIQPLVALGAPDPATQVYFSDADLARISALFPGGGITLPAHEIREQIDLGINIALGKDTTFHFDLPIKLNSEVKKKPQENGQSASAAPSDDASAAPAPPALNPPAEQAIQTTDGQMSTSPATEGTTPAPAGSSASGIQWIKVGKSFGPVQFNRFGLQFEADAKMVWAYLDASLSVAALTFTLDGLGMGTPINQLAPEFRLLGIGIDYKSGPVEIGASFLRTQIEAVMNGDVVVTPAYDEYSGLAIIKASAIGLSAIGAYSDLPDYKSLFIYAVLNAPIGGPSFFFVTGLAAGFGFNRAVKVPDVSQVGEFPLVNLAVSGGGSPLPADPAGRAAYIHDILDQLRDSIYPAKGQYFLAAGIHFTSFQLIDSFALLLVSFGEHFEIDVLGLSTVVVPPPVPGEAQVTPVAEVQLALKAVFNPAEGVLSVEAQLTSNSFILDRACHLTGGFAFYSWFSGPHQGDFVLTLGGYHPAFQKPEHYPTVPRLGLNWQATPDLLIKGGIYFALCPHLVMAGGRLEAVYQSGSLKASFILAADFLISWKPYHYDARISLDIEVEYTYHLVGTHHISASIDADVHVWGPDFSGHAHVHMWCVTFDIDFGAKTTPKLEPLDWTTFQQSFLPADTTKMVSMSVVNGLLRKENVKEGEQTVEQYVINPKDFQLSVDLVAPFNALKLGDADVALQTLQQVTVKGGPQIVAFTWQNGTYTQAIQGDAITTGAFGIAPMARSADQISSSLQLTAELQDADGNWQPAGELFGFRPVLKRAPRALWGKKLQQDLNGEPSIENVLSGMVVIPAKPPAPGESQWIAKQNLQYTTTHVEPGIGFEPMTAFTATDLGADQSSADYLKAHLTDQATMENRRQMLEALGFDYGRLGIKLTPDIATALVMDPQIGCLV